MQENFPINFPRRCDDSAPFPCFATCFKILKRGVPKKRDVPTLESNVDRNKYPKSRRFRISTLVTSDRRCSSNLIYKKENERSRVHEYITRKYFQKARDPSLEIWRKPTPPPSINSPPPQPFHPRLCYTRARFTYCFDTRWRATRRGNPRRIETKPPRGIVRLDAARIQMLLLDAFVDACRDTRMANDPWQRGESSPRHLLETIRHRFLLIRRNFERRHLRLVPSSYRWHVFTF